MSSLAFQQLRQTGGIDRVPVTQANTVWHGKPCCETASELISQWCRHSRPRPGSGHTSYVV